MLKKFSKYNTLRNQISAVFLLVMFIVLLLIGAITYNIVSTLLTSNAERQIQQTAIQASSHMDALYEQIDMLTSQVATDSYVQDLLYDEVEGVSASFNQRQSLMQLVNSYQAYFRGVYSFELYLSNYDRLFPLNEASLIGRLDVMAIRDAKDKNGQLVWVGEDPEDSNFFLVLRQVNLIDRWFSPGGFLLTRVNRSYLQFNEQSNPRNEQEEGYMFLLNKNNEVIYSSSENMFDLIPPQYEQTVKINNEEFLVVTHTSKLTGWTTMILTPLYTLTEDTDVLRTAILLSGAVGFIIFLLSSLVLSTMITKPIQKLTKTMSFSKLGTLKRNPNISSTVEINELNDTYNQMVDSINHLIQVVYEKEITRSRTELKALQAQINPHFLFNTLEALYWSLEENGEDELAEHVIAMSELFRYTISTPKKDSEWVRLKDELSHIERYMRIMTMRFGERLTWNIKVNEEDLLTKIPKLLIQPLVENAILHGVGNKKGAGHVSVNIERNIETSKLVIKVNDDGPGMDKNKVNLLLKSLKEGVAASDKGNGMALANVNKRLQLYYSKDVVNGLAINSEIGQGTCVSFEIPMNGGVG
ncbi:two-component system sensor histidine kinase YesM [Evansella vedderi]|uniref:histidine kinase n=1 Tax=Evansella vedderi TaxID=38282 RepID=A0ABT9ZY79_9BACI|nr:sensor histidine kinase [Evansella vedderi]MDQ0255920.1 two-component system sensor histidine kinase YesM [Evansella vedderi]